ncbi:hypothetical protein FN976_11115 [Caenimonas sedimenti]|uniref:Uncharacterized protein n=1 Tax=Caenimonas sedimenti TaxID=2596921 RepID=A0A562ZSZ5_9BURK|nr:hypothetical protein [Caenimonas sedimenti]TWO71458.1 hypothetical protein FN976_11115 [Caenimonas sedimenti]
MNTRMEVDGRPELSRDCRRPDIRIPRDRTATQEVDCWIRSDSQQFIKLGAIQSNEGADAKGFTFDVFYVPFGEERRSRRGEGLKPIE